MYFLSWHMSNKYRPHAGREILTHHVAQGNMSQIIVLTIISSLAYYICGSSIISTTFKYHATNYPILYWSRITVKWQYGWVREYGTRVRVHDTWVRGHDSIIRSERPRWMHHDGWLTYFGGLMSTAVMAMCCPVLLMDIFGDDISITVVDYYYICVSPCLTYHVLPCTTV